LSRSDEVNLLPTISLILVGEIFSLAEGEFNTLVIGNELVSFSFSDEVNLLPTISLILVGEIFSLAEGEFNTLVIGNELVSLMPVKFTEWYLLI